MMAHEDEVTIADLFKPRTRQLEEINRLAMELSLHLGSGSATWDRELSGLLFAFQQKVGERLTLVRSLSLDGTYGMITAPQPEQRRR
jgi:hypothetical protein